MSKRVLLLKKEDLMHRNINYRIQYTEKKGIKHAKRVYV